MAAEPQTVEVKPDSYSYVFVPYREAVASVNPEDRLTRATGSDLRGCALTPHLSHQVLKCTLSLRFNHADG